MRWRGLFQSQTARHRVNALVTPGRPQTGTAMHLSTQGIPLNPLLLNPTDCGSCSSGVPVDRPGHICVCALAPVRSANILIRTARRSRKQCSPSDKLLTGVHQNKRAQVWRQRRSDCRRAQTIEASRASAWNGPLPPHGGAAICNHEMDRRCRLKVAVRVLPLTFRCLSDPLWPRLEGAHE
jgi:hypothetical protein